MRVDRWACGWGMLGVGDRKGVVCVCGRGRVGKPDARRSAEWLRSARASAACLQVTANAAFPTGAPPPMPIPSWLVTLNSCPSGNQPAPIPPQHRSSPPPPFSAAPAEQHSTAQHGVAGTHRRRAAGAPPFTRCSARGTWAPSTHPPIHHPTHLHVGVAGALVCQVLLGHVGRVDHGLHGQQAQPLDCRGVWGWDGGGVGGGAVLVLA